MAVSTIYKDSKYMFAYKVEGKKIVLTSNNFLLTYNSSDKRLLGQFISSNWFNQVLDYDNDTTLYIIETNAYSTYEKVYDELYNYVEKYMETKNTEIKNIHTYTINQSVYREIYQTIKNSLSNYYNLFLDNNSIKLRVYCKLLDYEIVSKKYNPNYEYEGNINNYLPNNDDNDNDSVVSSLSAELEAGLSNITISTPYFTKYFN